MDLQVFKYGEKGSKGFSFILQKKKPWKIEMFFFLWVKCTTPIILFIRFFYPTLLWIKKNILNNLFYLESFLSYISSIR